MEIPIKARVYERNMVHIPTRIANFFGWKKGTNLMIIVTEEGVLIKKGKNK